MVTQRTFNPSIVGSSPVRSTIYGCVAQLAEQLTLNHQVAGSMPVAPTIYGHVVQLVRMPGCQPEGRRFKSGRGRQKVFVCGVNASICQGSGWIPDGQGLNLSGCRITVVSVAWDHVAKVRLLLLRPIWRVRRNG